MHEDFEQSKVKVYDICHLICSLPVVERESLEYGACSVDINGLKVLFRVAKTTPLKLGQFVAVWKRNEKGVTCPYDAKDDVDLFVICTRAGSHFGQFVFPKSVLVAMGIMSRSGIGGKRGIRVYPSWDQTISPIAKKTQEWQLGYFLEIPSDGTVDSLRATMLYGSCV